MSTAEIEQKVKRLIAAKKYDEAKELLKSSYNLSEEQAVAFIQKLEQTTGSGTKILKPGCGGKASKGCGCLALVFLIMATWGTYDMYKQYSDDVVVKAMVVDYSTAESTNSKGKLVTYYSPIVIYSFDGKDYRDTLNSSPSLSPEYDINETIDLYIDPQQPQWATPDSFWSSSTMYIPLLVLAVLSFVGYRVFGKLKLAGNPMAQLRGKMEKMAELQGKASAGEPVKNDFKPMTDPKGKPKVASPKMAFGLAFFFLLLAVGLIYLGHRAQQRGERIAKGETVIATVAGEHQERSQNRTTGYRYTVVYDYRGEPQEYETSVTFDHYDPGDKVELKINPDDPDEVALNMEEDLYGRRHPFMIIILLGLGGLMLYIGIHLVKRKKQAT